MNNYGFPPPYVMSGGFDLDAFIKFQEYMKTSNPANKPVKARSEFKDFLRFQKYIKEMGDVKKKEEDEAKKKADEDKKKKEATANALPSFSLIQTTMICATFGLPFGALWLTVMHHSFNIIKDMIFK